MTVQESIREPATEQMTRLAGACRVIRAKVKPAVSGGWVERARPEAVLTEAVESRRVVVLSAMAGSGKTTLVAAAARRLERPVAWLTVDCTDDAPGRLVTYLEAALAVVVPGVQGVVRDASAARIPPPEVAGRLVEAMAGEQVVLVVDELERLGDGSEGWGVMQAALRRAPSDMAFVLCSRGSVPARVLPRGPDEVGWLGDAVLALTVEEAGHVLAALGRPTVDPAAAVEATGGWVTGVLFEAWRLGEQAAGDGQEDSLYDYLTAHIVGELPAGDRDFLVATSVLTEVTADRAAAIGVREAGARMASLRSAHIPAEWKDGGRALRCHPRLREYLQDCLESWGAERLRQLQMRHRRLLVSEGR